MRVDVKYDSVDGGIYAMPAAFSRVLLLDRAGGKRSITSWRFMCLTISLSVLRSLSPLAGIGVLEGLVGNGINHPNEHMSARDIAGASACS